MPHAARAALVTSIKQEELGVYSESTVCITADV